VCSETDQRGGKMAKSQIATPGRADGHVSTVNIDGSCAVHHITISIVYCTAADHHHHHTTHSKCHEMAPAFAVQSLTSYTYRQFSPKIILLWFSQLDAVLQAATLILVIARVHKYSSRTNFKSLSLSSWVLSLLL